MSCMHAHGHASVAAREPGATTRHMWPAVSSLRVPEEINVIVRSDFGTDAIHDMHVNSLYRMITTSAKGHNRAKTRIHVFFHMR